MSSDNKRDDNHKRDDQHRSTGGGGNSRAPRPSGDDARKSSSPGGGRSGFKSRDSRPRSSSPRNSSPRNSDKRNAGERGSYARSDSPRSSGSRSGNPRSSGERRGGPVGENRGRGPAGGGRPGGPGGQTRGRGPARDSRSGGGRVTGRDQVRRDDRRNERDDGSRRGERSRQRPEIDVPEVPDDAHISQLDREVRQRLRTLSKDNAEDVAQHLVMAGALIEIDPELAYRHAQVAVARGGRVDVVREAGALTAYATGRYAEALRELRTVRRLSGSNEHLPLMADCERGLGRPERAIDLARSDDAATLGHRGSVEMEIVAAGARLDLEQPEAAYVALKRIETNEAALQDRVDIAMVPVLRALGRDEQADALEATLDEGTLDPTDNEIEFDITVYDVAELPIPEEETVSGEPTVEHLEEAGAVRDADEQEHGATNPEHTSEDKESQ